MSTTLTIIITTRCTKLLFVAIYASTSRTTGPSIHDFFCFRIHLRSLAASYVLPGADMSTCDGDIDKVWNKLKDKNH